MIKINLNRISKITIVKTTLKNPCCKNLSFICIFPITKKKNKEMKEEPINKKIPM